MACGHYYHVPCVSQWLLQGKTSTTCMLDVTPSVPKLRRQKAVARWVQDSYNSGYMLSQPPEVRVSRISLEKRQQRPAPILTSQPPPNNQQPPKSLKPGRKRRQRRLGELQSEERIPLAVSASRALSVQVQPLMAVLMSPRNLDNCSPNQSDGDNESTEEEEQEDRSSRRLQVSITSLELPETTSLSPCQGFSLRQPPRLKRGLPRRSASQPLPCFALGCTKMSLSPRRHPQ